MPYIPEDVIQQILDTADIVEVISEFLPLKRRGSNYVTLSPFKEETNPSFYVSPSKQIFKDFSSGKGGNVITFLMELEGMTFTEAVRWLAERYGIPLRWEKGEITSTYQEKERLYIIMRYAMQFYERCLQLAPEVQHYLQQRGISKQAIQHFHLGYAPNAADAFVKAALQQQFQREVLIESGLALRSGIQLKDFLRDRVVFPIRDRTGQVIGFAGRLLKDHPQLPKYINLGDTPIYQKSKVLYGLYENKEGILRQQSVWLVEGYFDVITLWQHGYRCAVATCGTALSKEHAAMIKRLAKKVVLLYDGDEAGKKAVLRILPLLVSKGLSIEVVLLPAGEDPDSFLKKEGKEAFEAYLKCHTKHFLTFFLEQQGAIEKLHQHPERLTEAIYNVATLLMEVPDVIQRKLYIEQSAQHLKVVPTLIEQALQLQWRQKQKQQQRLQRRHSLSLPTASLPPPQNHEKELLRLLFNYFDHHLDEHTTVLDFLGETLRKVQFQNPQFEQLRKKFFALIDQGVQNPIAVLVQDEALGSLVQSLLFFPYQLSQNWKQQEITVPEHDKPLAKTIENALLHYHFALVKQLLQQSQEQIKLCEQTGDREGMQRCMQVYLNAFKRLQELANRLSISV